MTRNKRALSQETAELQAQIDRHATDSARASKFMEIVCRYTDFDELSVPMINEFIAKVVVHEGDKSSGKRIQRVEVHMNFIGDIEIQQAEISAEEADAERKFDEKRKIQSERQCEWRKRKKEETAVKLNTAV